MNQRIALAVSPCLALVAAALLTGCQSPMFEGTVFAPQPDTEGARLRLAQDQASIDAARNRARLDAVEQGQRQLEASLAAMESQSRAAAGLNAEVAALRRDVTALRAERDQLRKEIVDDLSARVAKIMAAQGASTSRQPSPAPRAQSGRLHKVERGQTLSVIARAYKTTVEAVMKANNMTNPNQLREGMELFIPE
jgi:hypothetical protein